MGCVDAFGTGILDGGALAAAGLVLLPPPMFHTLRTSDFAAPKKPKRDALPLAVATVNQLHLTRAEDSMQTNLGVRPY